MKKWYKSIILIFLSIYSHVSEAQTVCTVPLSPTLLAVSVNPVNGRTELNWTLSPSSGVAAYIIYTFENGDGMPLDTLWDSAVTSYSYNTTASKYFSLSYVVSALRLPDCESPLSNSLNTIFCSPQIDTCKSEIQVRWNLYPDFPKPVLKYEINITRNAGAITEVFPVDAGTSVFTFSDFETDTEYCIMVRAILEGGGNSSSNISCLSTNMQRPPAWINSDYVTINEDNKISLSYTIDPLSEITKYRLERRNGWSGPFQPIAEISSNNNNVQYIDNEADAFSVHFYRLSAMNNCNISVITSTTASNLVLSLTRLGDDINLTWNAYRGWQGSLESYKLYVKASDGYEQLALTSPADTLYMISYSEIMYRITGSEVCFRIMAVENGNPNGVNGESSSGEKCSSTTEIITVPNLFTPDGDLVNDVFKPVLSFIPENYHLVISDRKGKTVFESKSDSEEWDGSLKGSQLPQDVYLWFLKTTGPSGKSVAKTGTVTIIRVR